MKLSECRMGEVVQGLDGRIGHIIGLVVNGSNETVPLIRFANRVDWTVREMVMKGEAVHPIDLERLSITI